VSDSELARHAFRPAGLGTPFLRGIVRRPALHEDIRTGVEQPARNGDADPSTTTDAGDERVLSSEIHP
jgi:hypothetical protein